MACSRSCSCGIRQHHAAVASQPAISIGSTSHLQVAEQALGIVEGLSGTPEGLASLRSAAQPLCKKLFRCAHNVSLSRSALTSLVNISQDARIAAHLVSTGACTTLLEYLHEGDTAHPDLVVMALSNLTQTDAGARSALQVRTSVSSVYGVVFQCRHAEADLALMSQTQCTSASHQHLDVHRGKVAGGNCNRRAHAAGWARQLRVQPDAALCCHWPQPLQLFRPLRTRARRRVQLHTLATRPRTSLGRRQGQWLWRTGGHAGEPVRCETDWSGSGDQERCGRSASRWQLGQGGARTRALASYAGALQLPLERVVTHWLYMLQRQTRAMSSCAQEGCQVDFVTHGQRLTSRGAGLAIYPVYVPIMTDWLQRHAWDWHTLATVLCAHKTCVYLHAGTYKWAATQRACGLGA